MQYAFQLGSEVTFGATDLWVYHRGVTPDFSRPGKPNDSAFFEPFNRSTA